MKLLLSRVVIPFVRTGNLTGLSHSNKPPGFAYTLTYITEKCRGYLIPLSGRYPPPPSNKCKTPHKQQYKLANWAAGNTGVADAGLYAYDTSKNSKKNTNVKNQPEPAKTSEDLEARDTKFATTIANKVADTIGNRLSKDLKSWRGRGRGRGRGQQYDGQSNRGRGQPHSGGPAANGQEEASRPGNEERLSKDSNPRQPPTQR